MKASKLYRLFFIWKAGRLRTAQKMKEIDNFMLWYYIRYGEWLQTIDEIKEQYLRSVGLHGYTYEQVRNF